MAPAKPQGVRPTVTTTTRAAPARTQRARAGIDGRAGREHVVDEDDRRARRALARATNAPRRFDAAGRGVEAGLRGRRPDPPEGADGERQARRARERPREQRRLIVAALAQAIDVQRDRHDERRRLRTRDQ